MSKFIQRGENKKYPMEIDTWRPCDKTTPSWLSDKCKVLEVKDDGTFVLETRMHDTGRKEYITPELLPIVSVKSDNDYICCGDLDIYTKGMIFSLTEKQFELLYKPKKKD